VASFGRQAWGKKDNAGASTEVAGTFVRWTEGRGALADSGLI